MDEKRKLGEILVRANQQTEKIYKTFTRSISDESLRKFLRMMLEHKEATRSLLSENTGLLNGTHDPESQLEEYTKDIEAGRLPINQYHKLPKTEFLRNLSQYEEKMEKIFERCCSVSETTEREDLFYSLLEDTKKQRALLRDRYELEQLL